MICVKTQCCKMQFPLSEYTKKWNDSHCSYLKVSMDEAVIFSHDYHSAISAISSCTSSSSSSNEDPPREACLMDTREQPSYIGRKEEVKGAGGNHGTTLQADVLGP